VIVRRIVTLSVELINERDIVVSQLQTGFSVTYRKDVDAPMLYAINGIDRSDDPLKVNLVGDPVKSLVSSANTHSGSKAKTLFDAGSTISGP